VQRSQALTLHLRLTSRTKPYVSTIDNNYTLALSQSDNMPSTNKTDEDKMVQQPLRRAVFDVV